VAKKERSRRDRAVPADDGSDRAATGIEGLDDVLGGGFARGRLHLVQGAPGAGKTTLALQFLLAGAARNESSLLISLSETEDELHATASSHGWSLEAIHVPTCRRSSSSPASTFSRACSSRPRVS
jgi:circadian clock protein KaiC